jgi:hypothetical protein
MILDVLEPDGYDMTGGVVSAAEFPVVRYLSRALRFRI